MPDLTREARRRGPREVPRPAPGLPRLVVADRRLSKLRGGGQRIASGPGAGRRRVRAEALVGALAGLNLVAWDVRTRVVVTLDCVEPGTVLGMIGAVVAKMAVEQASKSGSAVGVVHSLGAARSIPGTFLAGLIVICLA